MFKKTKVVIVILVFVLQMVMQFEFIGTTSYAANTGIIRVEFFNSNTSDSINTIYPNFRVTNLGSTSLDLSKVKLRYYYTIDGDKSQNFWCDWSSVGSSNVTGTFMKYVTPYTNADYYIEIGFKSGAGYLTSGSNIEVKSRIAKTDWSNYSQKNDYSFNSSASNYVEWNYVSGLIDDIEVYGIAPGELSSTSTPSITPTLTSTLTPPTTIPTVTPTSSSTILKVEFYNGNTSATINTIYPNFRITNLSSSSIDLSTVKLRYYYTIDGEKKQSFWCDWSTVGSANVNGTFTKLATSYTTADYYMEIGFTSGAGYLTSGSSIEVKTRFAKTNWRDFTQTNDYSFNGTITSYTEWNYVTAYVDNSLVWGIPPDIFYATPTPTATPTPILTSTPTATQTPTPTVTPIVTTAPQREAGAWYMFDSTITGSTTLSKDYKGNYGNATLNSGAIITSGRNRNGLSLDGVNDYASLPSGIVSSYGDFTIATWVKLDTSSNWQRIFDFGNNTSSYMYLSPNCPDVSAKGVKFAITTGGGWSEQTISSGYNLPIGVWKHVAVTLSGNTGILYIDGVEAGRNSSMTLKPSSLGSTSNNYIGKSQTSSDPYLDGMIDDFVIYNRALSDSELKTLAGSATRINDSDSGIVYSSGWSYKSGRSGSDYLYDVHDSDSAGGEDYFEYTFRGTGVNFIAPRYNGNSDAAIYIDGVYKKTMSMSGASNYISQTVTYSILDLTPGTHTIKVSCYNNTWGVADAIDILCSNQTPTDIVLPNTTIEENIPAGTMVGNLGTIDFNSEDTFTYALVSGEGSTDNASFSIAGNQLMILGSPDYETKNSYYIRLRTTDAGGLYYEKAFIISVTDVVEATPTPTTTATPKPTATRTPGPSPTIGQGSGLRGEYYDNMDFTNIKEVRIDPEVNFDWGAGSPSSYIDKDTFSVIWIGKVQPLYSEEYTFYTISDESIKLWVNGVPLIDNSIDHTSTEDFGIIDLEAGLKYDIRIEYHEKTSNAVAQLLWSSPSQEKEVIPRTQLYPPKMFTALEHSVRTVGNDFAIGDYVPVRMKIQVLWSIDNPVIGLDLNVRKPDGTASGFILKEIMSGSSINKNMFRVYVNGSIVGQTGFTVWTEGTGSDRKLKVKVLRSFTQNNVLQIDYIVKATASTAVFNMGIKEYLDANSLNNVNMKIFYEISEWDDLGLVISEAYSKDSTLDSSEKSKFQADIKLEDPILLE
ncbi:cellulose binding domain-containing protein [Acetivibrio cellulolyticus]|uniref:cellulose binding domain-containing protein n=1 Tax=Acetivibrio cellulolyticus TaxID=35830 RepID=UPI0001E2DE59|nr:cellulose binding domain-containing protein [Acetivibrio cellulolyticus]